jgi:uncharacterized protein (DUF2225 family)
MMDIGWLIENGPCKKLAAGENVPCSGGKDFSQRAMYILLSGMVDVLKKSAAGGTQRVASVIKGDVFGGREYFTAADEYTYIASEESIAYVVTEESFNDLSWSRPDIIFELLRAAYTPLRKPISAAKPVMSQEKAQAATQPTAAEDGKKAVKEDKIPAAEGKTPVIEAEKQQAQPKTTPAETKEAITESGGIFPQGHKHYPDITNPDNAKLIFPKEYVCPFCKKKFNDFRVFRSKLYENEPMRYDLRKYFKDFSIEWYDIITCQNCLFSTFHNYFTDPKPIQKAKIEKELTAMRSEVHLDFLAERDINYVFTSHYLAILSAAGYPTMGKQIRAKLWGNISWLYEDAGDKEMEKFAATQAAEAYEQVYTESRLTPVQEQITCLSIAGMQYRAGIDKNLKKFLFTAKTQKMGDKLYSKVAEEFMYELKLEDQ